MEIVGLIAEYNPFHNGHIYQISKIKELYPDSIIIAIITGYFTQRGTISYMTKENKIKCCLNEQIDIVLELPFIYATQSADIFAYEAIRILNEYKITKLVFGSESNDIKLLTNIANIQSSKEYNSEVKELMDKGINYPTALALSLHLSNFNFNPNDLLAISYIKAINKINNKIIPISIKRTNNYHDLSSNDKIISASNIRKKLEDNLLINSYTPYYDLIKLPNNDILFTMLKAKILTDSNLDSYLDVDEGVEYRLKDKITTSTTLDEFILKVKTKRYTYNKINRMLIHILIGLTKKDNITYPVYTKVLGFNALGKQYLNSIKSNLSISLNSTITNYEDTAAIIYDLIYNSNCYSFEHSKKPIIK